MKKHLILILVIFITLFPLNGCNKNSMNAIISNEPSVVGIVHEVHDEYIQIYMKNEGEIT